MHIHKNTDQEPVLNNLKSIKITYTFIYLLIAYKLFTIKKIK